MLVSLSKLLAHIKNATAARLEWTYTPYIPSHIKILEHFLNQGLIKSYLVTRNGIRVYTEPATSNYVKNLQMYSKPGLRKYTSLRELVELSKECYFGMISTTSGVVPLITAIKLRKGGEILFLIKYV